MLIGIVKKNAIMMIDFALDAQRNQGMAPAGGDPRGLPAALPADHDDDAGRADGRAADRARPRRRRRAAPAARPGGGRRPDLLAGDHALHHAGDLPRARPLQRQGPGADARGRRPTTAGASPQAGEEARQAAGSTTRPALGGQCRCGPGDSRGEDAEAGLPTLPASISSSVASRTSRTTSARRNAMPASGWLPSRTT